MRIKNMRVSGIKNLDNEYIEFSNKNIKSNKESVVKLLYGNCGSGKTAVLNAVDIYMGIITKHKFLEIYNTYLKTININGVIKFETDLLIGESNLTHIIEIKLDKNDFVVHYEKVIENKKVSYLYEDATILTSVIEEEYEFTEKTSVLSMFLDFTYYLFNVKNGMLAKEKFSFGHYKNYSPRLTKILDSSYTVLRHKDAEISTTNGKRIIALDYEYIDEYDIELYHPSLYKELIDAKVIESFFKLMNKNIISVDLYREYLDNDMCHEDMIIKYSNREIFLSNESPGMKKLLELFLAIYQSNDSIIILDDFDMYLSEKQSQLLLEYLIENHNSQIIASVQSTHLMSVVKHIPKAISIMDNGCAKTWRKNGNENPAKMFLSNKFVDETIDAKKMEEFFINMKTNYDEWIGPRIQQVVKKKENNNYGN